jgi:hypothetical protein
MKEIGALSPESSTLVQVRGEETYNDAIGAGRIVGSRGRLVSCSLETKYVLVV